MIINKITDILKKVEGVEAIVLGGSRAKGNYTEKSDIDIGIYYSDGTKLDLKALSSAATELDDEHRENLITEIGGWGPWINGGGWLTIDGIATDFLLRDLKKVSSVIDDCLNKNITIDYQPGHPHGFVNAIYAAEVFYCKVLWSRNDTLQNLKSKLMPYPVSIKRGIVEKFLWEADFSCGIAVKGIPKKDIVYISGCLYRAVTCLVQVIYALNETFIMNEKGALAALDTFEIQPRAFKNRVEKVFASLTTEPETIEELIAEISNIVKEVEELWK